MLERTAERVNTNVKPAGETRRNQPESLGRAGICVTGV